MTSTTTTRPRHTSSAATSSWRHPWLDEDAEVTAPLLLPPTHRSAPSAQALQRRPRTGLRTAFVALAVVLLVGTAGGVYLLGATSSSAAVAPSGQAVAPVVDGPELLEADEVLTGQRPTTAQRLARSTTHLLETADGPVVLDTAAGTVALGGGQAREAHDARRVGLRIAVDPNTRSRVGRAVAFGALGAMTGSGATAHVLVQGPGVLWRGRLRPSSTNDATAFADLFTLWRSSDIWPCRHVGGVLMASARQRRAHRPAGRADERPRGR